MAPESDIGFFNFKEDAKRVFDVLKNGGIAICPASVGYAIVTCNPRKLEKIFLAKQRAPIKRHGTIGSYTVHRAVHVMDPRSQDIVDHIVHDLDLPLGVIANYREDHPLYSGLDENTMDATSVDGTIAVLVNAGTFHDELQKLTLPANMACLGSSANMSRTGTKYRVEDIQPELLDLADIVIDYGLLKYNRYQRSSTMIDFSGPTPEVVRVGACYEIIKDALWRRWEIVLPEDPGLQSNPFGHLKVPPPLKSLERLISQNAQVV